MKKQNGRNFAYRAAVRMLLFTGSPASPAEAGGLLYFGIFVLITGLVSIIYPYFFWNVGLGRKVRIPPPTLYLTMLRIGGVLACAVAAVMLWKVSRL